MFHTCRYIYNIQLYQVLYKAASTTFIKLNSVFSFQEAYMFQTLKILNTLNGINIAVTFKTFMATMTLHLKGTDVTKINTMLKLWL